ncbi:MAG: hypothetical protein AAGD38_11835 [Acidobacteriota bacterium]
MNKDIPLRVLGSLGPILSWVEGLRSQALPRGWHITETRGVLFGSRPGELSASEQERDWLLQELPTFSLDTVDEVVTYSREGGTLSTAQRWRSWGGRLTPPRGYDLFCVLEALADRYLTWSGGKVVIREGRMVELHELGLRMSLGCIVRHVHARAVAAGEQPSERVEQLPEAVSLLPSNTFGVRSVTRRGLAEGHLHLNSVHATEVAWVDHLLKPIGRRPKGFEPVEWRFLRLGRCAARMLAFATFICLARNHLDEKRMSDLRGLTSRLRKVFDAMYFAPGPTEMRISVGRFREILRSCLDYVDETWPGVGFHGQWPGWPDTGSERICGPWRWLDPWRPQARPMGWRSPAHEPLVERERHLASLHLAAHLALVNAHVRAANTERREQAERAGDASHYRATYVDPIDRFLHGAMFRYVVCRTHHWQLGVQQGRSTGLRHFKRYYDSNQRWQIRGSQREQASAVIRRASEWRGLRMLEGRIAPPSRPERDVMPWLEAFAEGVGRERIEKMGLVVHFIKDRERRSASDASFRPARYEGLRRRYRREAFRLFLQLEKPRLYTPFVVGIDAANLENTTPPEVFAPIFRFLRERPIELRGAELGDLDNRVQLRDLQRLVDKRRLGMTYHVGEEFRHLLSGLRAIDEVIEFLVPQPGDRLGHAIALGLEPRVWLENTGFQALLPKQEWLDTLVWVHHLLGPGDDLLGLLEIENRIERLAHEIYGCRETLPLRQVNQPHLPHQLTPVRLYDAWRLRQLDPDLVESAEPSSNHEHGEIRFRPLSGDDAATWRWNVIHKKIMSQLKEKVGSNPPLLLLELYWYGRTAREEGDKLILVDMEAKADAWMELCKKTQEHLQQRVSKRQLTVEVNPSTNRIIGPMNRLVDHHVFNLTLDKKGKPSSRIHVSINTDNPGTSNTSLTHEYYLLGEAMLAKGYDEPLVIEWLESLRRCGKEASFVRQLPGPDNETMRKVLNCLRSRARPLHTYRDPDERLEALWRSIARSNNRERSWAAHQRAREDLIELDSAQRRAREDRIELDSARRHTRDKLAELEQDRAAMRDELTELRTQIKKLTERLEQQG